MIVNKKNSYKTAKNLPNGQKREIENGFKEEIQSVINGIDDRQSSKFTATGAEGIKPSAISDKEPEIDLIEARETVLKEIKSQESKEEGLEKKELTPRFKLSALRLKFKKLKPRGSKPIFKEQKLIKKDKVLKVNLASYLKVIIKAVLFLLIFCFIVIMAGLYLGRWQGSLMVKFTKIIPLPAVYVNGHSIKAHTFISDVAVLANYFERRGQEVTDQAVRKQVIERLIEMELIEQLAKAKGRTVTEAELQLQLNTIVPDRDSQQEAELMAQELYGWNFQTYLKKVVRPLLLRLKVEEDFYKSDGSGYIKEKMEGIYNLLLNDQTRFAKIASEVNQDGSQVTHGDLGWLSLGEIVPEFELQLLELQIGQISPVVETRYGYHIIKLEEKMLDSNDQPVFHVSHIYLKRPSFNDYLEEQIKKATIVTLIRI